MTSNTVKESTVPSGISQLAADELPQLCFFRTVNMLCSAACATHVAAVAAVHYDKHYTAHRDCSERLQWLQWLHVWLHVLHVLHGSAVIPQ
jgi:hypothetical protein